MCNSQCENVKLACPSLYNCVPIYFLPLQRKLHLLTDDEYGERSVSVSLDGDESELIFIDHAAGEMSVSSLKMHFYISCRKNGLKM